MPFNHYPQPNVGHWKPDWDVFNENEDRLLVYTWDRDERIVLAWSSGERSTGGLVVAQEAIPENVAWHFGDKLEPFEYAPGEFMQPQLFVSQGEDNRLSFKLAHPVYEGAFETSDRVRRVHRVKRGRRRHSLEVAGRGEPITRAPWAP